MSVRSRPGEAARGTAARQGTGADARVALEPQNPFLTCAVAWLVPGGGHFMLGWNRKALIFFGVLTMMYVLGLGLDGRLFPFQMTEPLVFLSALAEWTLGLPRLAAFIGGFGHGDVVAIGYEYGNTFLIVSGLLNALVVLDAYDIATGRKPSAGAHAARLTQ